MYEDGYEHEHAEENVQWLHGWQAPVLRVGIQDRWSHVPDAEGIWVVRGSFGEVSEAVDDWRFHIRIEVVQEIGSRRVV